VRTSAGHGKRLRATMTKHRGLIMPEISADRPRQKLHVKCMGQDKLREIPLVGACNRLPVTGCQGSVNFNLRGWSCIRPDLVYVRAGHRELRYALPERERETQYNTRGQKLKRLDTLTQLKLGRRGDQRCACFMGFMLTIEIYNMVINGGCSEYKASMDFCQ
jgi:hypothetical protein